MQCWRATITNGHTPSGGLLSKSLCICCKDNILANDRSLSASLPNSCLLPDYPQTRLWPRVETCSLNRRRFGDQLGFKASPDYDCGVCKWRTGGFLEHSTTFLASLRLCLPSIQSERCHRIAVIDTRAALQVDVPKDPCPPYVWQPSQQSHIKPFLANSYPCLTSNPGGIRLRTMSAYFHLGYLEGLPRSIF